MIKELERREFRIYGIQNAKTVQNVNIRERAKMIQM